MTNELNESAQPNSLPAEQTYQQRSDRFATEAERYGRHEGKLILARGLTFLAGAACLLMGFLDPDVRPVWIAGGTVLLLAFLALAILDDWFKRRKDHLLQLRQVNQWQLARKQRNWNAVPVPKVQVPAEHAAVAKDLDLFGHASLFQLICLANTPRGIASLRNWILEPATSDEIARRQQAVRELVPELELREELVLRGHMLSGGLAGPEAFITWAEAKPLLDRYPWLKWVSRILPVVGLLAVCALVTGWLSADVSAALFVVVLVVNVLFSVIFTGKVHDIFDNISTRNGELRHYLALFELLGEIPNTAPRLAEIQQLAVKEDGGALRHLQRLNWVMKLAALRHDPLLSILYFGLQATMLWDFHSLWLLERWQRRCQHHVRHWFDALGEMEALFSLSNLAFDHPTWCFPTIENAEPRVVRGTGVGHPLLSDADASCQRCGSRAGGDRVAGNRIEHVGQEYAVASHWAQRHPGGSGRARVCRSPAFATADRDHQHAYPRLLGGRCLLLHGRVETAQVDRRSGQRLCTIGTAHAALLVGRDSAGHQFGGAAHGSGASAGTSGRRRSHWCRLDSRSRTGKITRIGRLLSSRAFSRDVAQRADRTAHDL